MFTRKIIEIDDSKCDGCGLCIPDCPEGALQIIDGKVRLLNDVYCDGLGACLNSCPVDAIKVIERAAEPYNEELVMENIVKQGDSVLKAHLQHLEEHNEQEYLKASLDYLKEKGLRNPLEGAKTASEPGGCPGAAIQEFDDSSEVNNAEIMSALRQWPVQLNLLPPFAPFFNNSHLLVAADCVPFADPNFHARQLKGKSLAIGCPKFDDIYAYRDKLTQIFRNNNIHSVTVAIMEVPCCHGLYTVVEQAVEQSGKKVPIKAEVITVQGERQ